MHPGLERGVSFSSASLTGRAGQQETPKLCEASWIWAGGEKKKQKKKAEGFHLIAIKGML